MDDEPPTGSRLLQITEPDLADLEHMLPELMMAGMTQWQGRQRVQWSRVIEIVKNVRWQYGPPTNVGTVEG